MNVRFAPVVAAALLLVAGCGDDDGGGAAASTTTSAPASATTSGEATTSTDATTTTLGPAAAADQATIEVLDPGAEPRRELHYDLEPGDGIPVQLQTTVGQTVNGTATPPVTITFDATTTVTAVDGGIADVELRYDAIHVAAAGGADPAQAGQAAQTEAALQALVGLTTSMRMDDHGRILSTDVDTSTVSPQVATFVDQVLGSTTQLAVGLPDDAVGEGAHWQAEATTELAGVTTATTTDTTLVTLGDGAVEIQATATAELSGVVTGTATSTAQLHVDLRSPLAEGSTVGDNTVQSQGTTLTQHLEVRLTRR